MGFDKIRKYLGTGGIWMQILLLVPSISPPYPSLQFYKDIRFQLDTISSFMNPERQLEAMNAYSYQPRTGCSLCGTTPDVTASNWSYSTPAKTGD